MSAAAARTVPTEKTLKEYAEALASRGHVKAAAELIDAHLAQHDAGWGLWTTFAQLSRRLGHHELAVAAYRASARQLEAAGHLGHAHAALKAALALTPGDALLRDDVARLAKLRDRNRERPTLHVEPSDARAVHLVPPPRPTPPTVKPIPPPIPARLRASANARTSAAPRPAPPLARVLEAPRLAPAPRPAPAPGVPATRPAPRLAPAPAVAAEGAAAPARLAAEPRPARAPATSRAAPRARPVGSAPRLTAVAATPRAPTTSRPAPRLPAQAPGKRPSVTDPYLAIFDILDDEKRAAQRRAR